MATTSVGLEGVVAVETSIAEPDRDGGVLRYRGIDIRELIDAAIPFEGVWSLLVDADIGGERLPWLSTPAVTPQGDPILRLQAMVAECGAQWELGKLIDLDREQVRNDLARLSAAMFRTAASLAAMEGGGAPVDDQVDGALVDRVLHRWLGNVSSAQARALSAYWICTAEHGLNASTFTARIAASTGADSAACLSAAVGALSGPLHGGAPARVLPMVNEAMAAATVESGVRAILERGERLMGFGHRVYRAEDPRAAILRQIALDVDAPSAEAALAFEHAALAELERRKPDRVLATNVEFWSAVVLEAAGVSMAMAPVMFACARSAGWSAHILEQLDTGRLIRPAARYVGPPERTLADVLG